MPPIPSPEQMIASGPTGPSTTPPPEFEPLPTSSEPVAPAAPAPRRPNVPDSPADVAINDETRGSDVLKMFEAKKSGVKEPTLPKAKAETKSTNEQQPKPKESDEEEATAELLPPTAASEEATQPANTEESTTPDAKSDAVVIPPAVAKFVGNAAKEWSIAQLKRQKQLTEELAALKEVKSGEKGTSWYEHPDSYVLTPEYNNSQAALSQYKAVLNHYQRQLVNIREGEEWEDLGVNKDGTLYRQLAKKKPNAEADVMVQERIAHARQLIAEESAAQQQFVQEHQQRSSAVPTILSEMTNKYFPQYKQGIVSQNPQITQYVQSAEQQLAMLNMQHNPLTPFLTRLYAAFLELKLSQSTGQQRQVVNTQTQRNAGPTQDNINSGGSAISKSSDPDELPFDPKQWSR